MPYDITKVIFNNNEIYSFNNLIKIAFKDKDTINLTLSSPLTNECKQSNITECNINDVEKYISADINLIGLICSCHLLK